MSDTPDEEMESMQSRIRISATCRKMNESMKSPWIRTGYN